MAKNTKLSDAVVDVQANALGALLANGFIDIFDGVQPDGPDTPIGTQKRCVTLRFGSPAFSSSVKGVISATAIASGVAEETVSNATWARLYRSDHKTAVMDQSVGTKDANIILPTTHIVKGVTVSLSSMKHSVAKSALGI